jgi:hypothetical protein
MSRGGSTVVRITGYEGHSAYSIKKVTQERAGSSIVVLVYLFIARAPDTRDLNIDISVPESVNEIQFGKQRTLVWKRGQDTEIRRPPGQS